MRRIADWLNGLSWVWLLIIVFVGFVVWLIRGLVGSRPASMTGNFVRVDTDEGYFFEGEDIHIMNLPAGKRVIATARFKDARGNPGAAIQPDSGTLVVQDETIVTATRQPDTPGDDGKVREAKVEILSLGPLGASAVTLQDVDGDPSEGVTPVAPISGAVNVVVGNAVVGEFEFAEPTD